jgi:major membrane immunogen (membrane-anchored lipoprotein)
VNGSIIQFPAGITALTGSDFDIDKMFLARYNYEIKDGKLSKVQYDADGDLKSMTDE